MKTLTTLVRILALLFVVPATYYFVYWVPFSMVPFEGTRGIANVVSLLAAAGAGWFIWKKLGDASPDLISTVMKGAVLVGGIGFTIGFFGPIIFAPGANQGPLLGLFVTGPGGFVLGAVGGLIYWFINERETRTY